MRTCPKNDILVANTFYSTVKNKKLPETSLWKMYAVWSGWQSLWYYLIFPYRVLTLFHTRNNTASSTCQLSNDKSKSDKRTHDHISVTIVFSFNTDIYYITKVFLKSLTYYFFSNVKFFLRSFLSRCFVYKYKVDLFYIFKAQAQPNPRIVSGRIGYRPKIKHFHEINNYNVL